jgi:hypothetical protein
VVLGAANGEIGVAFPAEAGFVEGGADNAVANFSAGCFEGNASVVGTAGAGGFDGTSTFTGADGTPSKELKPRPRRVGLTLDPEGRGSLFAGMVPPCTNGVNRVG